MTTSSATKIPAIPQIKGLPPLAVMALQAIKETLEVREGLHEPLDRFISVRELADLILDDEKIVTYLGSGHSHDARYYTETEWNLTAKGDLNVAQGAGVPGTLSVGANNKLIRADSGATLGVEYFSLLGTTNQLTVTHNASDTTLSLPQNIHSGASPTFTGLTLSGLTVGSVPFIKAGGLIGENNSAFFFQEDDSYGQLAVGDSAVMRNTFQAVREDNILVMDNMKALITARNKGTSNDNFAGFSSQTLDTGGNVHSGVRFLAQFTSHALNAVSADMIFETRHAGARSEKMRLSSDGNLSISSIAAGVADYDKFIVSDGGTLKYRTGAELLGDIEGTPTADWNQNGFENRTDSSITFTDGTRTLSIQPTAANFSYWVEGTKYTSTGDTVVITDVEGIHAIYYDGSTLTALANPTTGNVSTIIRTKAFVSVLYWDTSGATAIYVGEERHGVSMAPVTHSYLHFTKGLSYESGLGLNTISIDGNGTVNSHAQFGVDSGAIYDEDLYLAPAAVVAATGLPIYYMLGAAAEWQKYTNDGFSVRTFDGTTGTRLAYNQYAGGAWQLTEVGNLDFVLYHVFATTEKDKPIVVFMGQATYATLRLARAGANVEVHSLLLDDILFPEIKPIATLIFKTGTAYTNDVKGAIVSTDEGDEYVDWRDESISKVSVTSSDHNSLTGIQGGGAAERYHLTSAQETDLTDGNDCGIHKHDDIYFTETEHLNISAGAGDAGKPIKLDADGHVDTTMINDGDIDHGSIGGLGDSADHAWALLIDGTRSLTADWNIGNFKLGINAVPSYPLHLSYSPGDVFGRGVYLDINPTGTHTAARELHGIYLDIDTSADRNTFSSNLRGIKVDIENTGDLLEISGLYSWVKHNSASALNALTGLDNYVYIYTGDVSIARGCHNSVYYSSGGGTTGVGSRNTVQMSAVGKTLLNGYGTYSYITQTDGAITTGYLYYGGYSGTIGTKWGLYLTGETKNYFSGRVGIGITTPGSPLEVIGDSSLKGNLYLGLTAVNATSLIEVGYNSSGNRYAYIDLIGDDTYTDYGLRIIRNNTGANTDSLIKHRGTGNLYLSAADAGQVRLATNSITRMTIASDGNITLCDAKYLATDEVRARDSGGLCLKDDAGNLGVFVEDGGQVGIGTATPGVRLEVAGGGGIKITPGADNVDLLYFSTDRSWKFHTTGSDGATQLKLKAMSGGKCFIIQNVSDQTVVSFYACSEVDGSQSKVGIREAIPTAALDIGSDIIRLRTAKTPASASATGNAGDICWDASYIYVCTATNTWERAAIATW